MIMMMMVIIIIIIIIITFWPYAMVGLPHSDNFIPPNTKTEKVLKNKAIMKVIPFVSIRVSLP